MLVDISQVVEFTATERAQIDAHLNTQCDCMYNKVHPELVAILWNKISNRKDNSIPSVDFEGIELIDVAIKEPKLKTPTL